MVTCVHALASGRLMSNEEVTSLTVVRGEKAKLPCFLTPDVKNVNWTSKNIGLISENWRILPTTKRYQIEQNRTRDWILVIMNVQHSDNGVYTCSCSGMSRYEMKVHLTVVNAPTNTKNRIDQTTSFSRRTMSTDISGVTSFSTTEIQTRSTQKQRPEQHHFASGACKVWSCTALILFTLLLSINAMTHFQGYIILTKRKT